MRRVVDRADELAADVIVVTDLPNWKVGWPALTWALRGMAEVHVTVRALERPVHSGMWGGPVPDALTGLARLLRTHAAGLRHVVTPGELSAGGGPGPEAAPDDLALLQYTSGSTGTPKGVLHHHGAIPATVESYAAEILKLSKDDLTYSASRLFFAYGLGNSLSFPLAAGATVLLDRDRPTPERIASLLLDKKPTVFFAVPAVFRALLELKARGVEIDLADLRLCVSAGEALPGRIFDECAEQFGKVILDGIGSTEMLHIFISNRPDNAKAGSSGLPVSGYVHAETRDLLMPTVAPLDLEGHIVGVAFLKDIPFFAGAAGTVHRLDHGHKTTEAHDGLLSLAYDEASDTLLTGGEDGKVMRISADGTTSLVAETPRKWIAEVAAGPQGAVAYAFGKTTYVRLADGTTYYFRLAASNLNGVVFGATYTDVYATLPALTVPSAPAAKTTPRARNGRRAARGRRDGPACWRPGSDADRGPFRGSPAPARRAWQPPCRRLSPGARPRDSGGSGRREDPPGRGLSREAPGMPRDSLGPRRDRPFSTAARPGC